MRGKKVTVGYWYSFAIHMGICRGPVNELIEIRVGDKTTWHGRKPPDAPVPPIVVPPPAWISGWPNYSYEFDFGEIFSINKPNLFGGEKGEGGINGWIQLCFGKAGQIAPSFISYVGGGPKPGYRGVFTAIYDGRVCALNPYPKPWSFRVRRSTEGWDGDPWYPEKALIVLTRPTVAGEVTSESEIHAMNPAHILMECLTNRLWGRGLPISRIDQASFVRAADTLYDEQLGLCLRWVRRDSIKSFVSSVLDHIGASLFNDRGTGLIYIKLIRSDYDPDALPLFDADSGLLTVEEAPIASLGPTVNECKVIYRDPITNKDMTVTVQNLGAIQASAGVFNSIERKFPGLPTPDLALRAAQRELRMNAVGLRRFKVKLDRRGWNLVPGGLFRIRDLSRGIDTTVLRIGRIESGPFTKGEITITAMSDVFAFPLSSFVDQQPSIPQLTFTAQPTKSRVFEIPYVTLARYLTQADFAYIGEDSGYVGMVARQPDPVHAGFDAGVRDGPPDPDDFP